MMQHATLEARFAAALADTELPLPEGLTSARGQPDRLRFAVYRNNVHVSLVEALVRAFPVVYRIVGDTFFRAMARAYVAVHKPEDAVLIRYGASFSDFIASFTPAGSLAYLADVARLEYAWSEAYHAADADPIGLQSLAAVASEMLPDTRLIAHPATRLLASSHAIGSIWAAHQQERVPPVQTALAQTVLVTRPEAEVKASILPAVDAPFITALLAGDTIGDAAEEAGRHSSDFNPRAALAGLISLGAISGLQVNSQETF